MKSAFAAAIVLAGAAFAATSAEAQAAGHGLRRCTARVVYSEELPFAPIDSWLVNVTLEITPRNGVPYYTTLREQMPSQGPPPRRGQAFRLWCDPAHPNDVRLAPRTASNGRLPKSRPQQTARDMILTSVHCTWPELCKQT